MIAIIPARAGSKGLPGKNIKLLNGKPLIKWTFDAAKMSKNISRVILSTDSKEIAELGLANKIEVPGIRPDRLANDDSLVNDTLKYMIANINKDLKIEVPEIIILQPTSPLRTYIDIDNAIDLYKSKNADSVVSYTPCERPIEWNRYLSNENKIEPKQNETLSNRQSKMQSFYPNGAVYIIKSELIMAGKWYSEKSYAYIMPRNRSVDIDSMEDFEYAEFLQKKIINI